MSQSDDNAPQKPAGSGMLGDLLASIPSVGPLGDPLAKQPENLDAPVPGSAASISFGASAPAVASNVPVPPTVVQPMATSVSAVPVPPPAIPASVVESKPPVLNADPFAGMAFVVAEGASLPGDSPSIVPTPPPVKKPKQPVKASDYFKAIGALLTAALIFFGSFLAYIVFNPDQAEFFLQFNINRSDIAILLERLVNGIFGSISFIVSIVWFLFLYQAFVTKKEYKKKKTVAVILSVFTGIFLFSAIAFWAFLIKTIGAQDFVNPNGWVIVYDNDRLMSGTDKSDALVYDFRNMIGPVTLKFDLSSDYRYASKTMIIESFEVDLDGDGQMDKEGPDPAAAQDLIFTYSQKGKFDPSGSYVGIDKISREKKIMPIKFDPILISAIVVITKTKKGTVYDAKDALPLGKPKWYEGKDMEPVSSEAIYTAKPLKEDRILCLLLENATKKNEVCDKIFVVMSFGDSPIDAKIEMERTKDDYFTFRFYLKDVKVRTGWDIAKYKWMNDQGSVLGSTEEIEVTYNGFGKQKIKAILTDAAGNTVDFDYDFTIAQPLSLVHREGESPLLKVMNVDSDDNLLDGVYDKTIKSYLIEKFTVPSKLIFDASDVKVGEPNYELENVDWEFWAGASALKKSGKRVDFELIKDGRTEITVKYTFFHKIRESRSDVEEKIIFDGKKKDLVASMKVYQDSEYAPVTIKFDGSASRVKQGTITKFIYDFGIGSEPAEGDAVQTFRYDTPGEYMVTFTVVKDDGTKDVATRKIVVKDAPKNLAIVPSVSTPYAGKSVDFSLKASGQIETYLWDFGDSSGTSSEPNPTHVFESVGDYRVTLQVRYADGTLRNSEYTIKVQKMQN